MRCHICGEVTDVLHAYRLFDSRRMWLCRSCLLKIRKIDKRGNDGD